MIPMVVLIARDRVIEYCASSGETNGMLMVSIENRAKNGWRLVTVYNWGSPVAIFERKVPG